MYSVEGISQGTVCLLSSAAGQSRMLNRALIIIAPALESNTRIYTSILPLVEALQVME